jgi:hypothetical protein
MNNHDGGLGVMTTHNVIIEDFLSTCFPGHSYSGSGVGEEEFRRLSAEVRRNRFRELKIFCRLDSNGGSLMDYVKRQMKSPERKKWVY